MAGRAVLVGHDIASCQGLEALEVELRKRGWHVNPYLGRGKEYDSKISHLIYTIPATTDVVILGMSSQKETAHEEIAAGTRAAELRIPTFLYCDLFNTWARPHFAQFIRDHSQLVHFFVLYEESARKVCEWYLGVKAFVTGKPGWEQYGTPPTTRAEARAMLGISEDEKIILCPGGKHIAINMLLFGAVVEVAFGMKPPPTVVLSVHGGDPAGRDAYLCFEEWSDIQVIVPEIPRCRASLILPGADVVVASMSTIGEEAGFQKIPTINFISHVAMVHHEQSSGERSWAPIDLGLEDEVLGSIDYLRERISLLFDPDSPLSRAIREKQEELLMMKKPGTAARLMADAIEKVIKVRK